MAGLTASASLKELGNWPIYWVKIGCITAVGPRHLEDDSWVVSSLGTPLRSYGKTEAEHQIADLAYVIDLRNYRISLVFFVLRYSV